MGYTPCTSRFVFSYSQHIHIAITSPIFRQSHLVCNHAIETKGNVYSIILLYICIYIYTEYVYKYDNYLINVLA